MSCQNDVGGPADQVRRLVTLETNTWVTLYQMLNTDDERLRLTMAETVREELAVSGLLNDLTCRSIDSGRDSPVCSYLERSLLRRMYDPPQSLVPQRDDRVRQRKCL